MTFSIDNPEGGCNNPPPLRKICLGKKPGELGLTVMIAAQFDLPSSSSGILFNIPGGTRRKGLDQEVSSQRRPMRRLLLFGVGGWDGGVLFCLFVYFLLLFFCFVLFCFVFVFFTL